MPFEQYHEPAAELPEEVRTFARICASLIEEAEAIGWYEQRLALAVSLVVTAALARAPLALLLPALVVAGALSLSWNALSFTAAAELAGRARSGAALGFQQTALAVASTAAPPAFAAVVDASSWGVGFGLAALFPLAGLAVMRQLEI